MSIKKPKKDWYEAFADKAHELIPGWDFTTDLTSEQEEACLKHADSLAERPEAER